MISRDKLIELIEPHFKKDLVQSSYGSKKVRAKKKLTHTRFDLGFKLLYLDLMNKDVCFAKDIYKEHIRAFSLGKFTEPGNNEKSGIEKFLGDFHKTYDDIKTNGFDSSKSLIPLSANGSIANGSHRVACAICLDRDVKCVDINTDDHIYDYKFFYKRNVPGSMLDVAATKFAEYSDNVHVAFIWPTAQGHDNKIEEVIPNIVYRKDVKLTANGAHNLISQIYYGEDWLGDVKTDFKGAKNKLVECFKSFNPVRVIEFQADNLDEVLAIKDKLRTVFNVGKHSVHITDTKEEALRVARLVFNDNSIHFLNYAKPNKYVSTYTKIAKFKQFIKKNKISSDDVVLDSGIVLAAYGLREPKDIDYFVDDNEKLKCSDDGLEYHDDELEYHDENKLELIYNPQNYFYFNDVKFISFAQIFKMKKKRGEVKDVNDCKMMEALIENDGFKIKINQWKQLFFYWKVRFRLKVLDSLKRYGLYERVRQIYRFLRGKR